MITRLAIFLFFVVIMAVLPLSGLPVRAITSIAISVAMFFAIFRGFWLLNTTDLGLKDGLVIAMIVVCCASLTVSTLQIGRAPIQVYKEIGEITAGIAIVLSAVVLYLQYAKSGVNTEPNRSKHRWALQAYLILGAQNLGHLFVYFNY